MGAINYEFSLIYFIYGLAFFSMGLTILVEILRSGIKEARDLLPLAIFGLVHGSHEWLEMVLNLELTLSGELPIYWHFIRTFLLAFSFASLIGYGVRILSAQSQRDLNDFVVGTGMIGLYLISLFFGGGIPSAGQSDWVLTADVLARLLLASPGALITSVAIGFQSRDALSEGRTQLARNLRWAGVGFALYGVTQLLGPLVNLTAELSKSITEVIHYPIPAARALLAVMITLSIIRMTQTLEQERRQELETAQHDRLDALEKVQHELQLRNDLRKELLRRTVILQEEERTRISRELHDDAAQTLTAFNANLAALKIHLGEDNQTQEFLRRLSGLTDQMSDSIHKLVKDLRPAQLDELGIHAALQSLIDENEKHLGIQIDFEFNKVCDRLDPVLETVIYRIVQEALANVAKHAKTEAAIVRLISKPKSIGIEIEDHGIGFDPQNDNGGGFGLIGLAERALSLGGILDVKSSPESGTTISAIFALEKPCAKEGQDD